MQKENGTVIIDATEKFAERRRMCGTVTTMKSGTEELYDMVTKSEEPEVDHELIASRLDAMLAGLASGSF